MRITVDRTALANSISELQTLLAELSASGLSAHQIDTLAAAQQRVQVLAELLAQGS